MKYLLDTCVLSDFVKGESCTLSNLKATEPRDIAVSTITLMEVEYGLQLNPTKAQKIQSVIRELVSAIMLLPFGEKEAAVAGRIRSELKAQGRPIGAYDLLIAATAVTHQMTAVTANCDEFERVAQLAVVNWRKPAVSIA